LELESESEGKRLQRRKERAGGFEGKEESSGVGRRRRRPEGERLSGVEMTRMPLPASETLGGFGFRLGKLPFMRAVFMLVLNLRLSPAVLSGYGTARF
jgi:hypothetical protein